MGLLARVAVAAVIVVAGAAAGDDIKVNPLASYLRANGETPPGALVVSLAGVGVAPGDWVYLEVLGDWDCGAPCGDETQNLLFVFSSTSELLGPGELHRVPGAIDVCPDFMTANTFVGGLPTDIAEDFLIGNDSPLFLSIEVPEGAAFLFVAVHDSQYKDNSDPDQDLYVRVEPTKEPCIGDYNEDGVKNILDFVAFQTGFQEMACRADCNGDGVWNILDFVCFQLVFVGGCG